VSGRRYKEGEEPYYDEGYEDGRRDALALRCPTTGRPVEDCSCEDCDPEEAEIIQEAREAATCGECLARTYRYEECVCPGDGFYEVYDEALERIRAQHAARDATVDPEDEEGLGA
jgi:hypothetical protein